ncbi:MAG: hypothetical protein AAF806_24320 [Bacteroidota bacterium]
MANQNNLDKSVKASFLLLFLMAISIIMIVQPYEIADFFEEEISEEINEEQALLEEPKQAELYVLRATLSKKYPCYNCPNLDSIFLSANEVWKYGVLTEEENEQYTDEYLRANFLAYFIQFEGTVEECLAQQKVKIRNYALLSENLKREVPLLKPPGNR